MENKSVCLRSFFLQVMALKLFNYHRFLYNLAKFILLLCNLMYIMLFYFTSRSCNLFLLNKLNSFSKVVFIVGIRPRSCYKILYTTENASLPAGRNSLTRCAVLFKMNRVHGWLQGRTCRAPAS